MEILLRRAAAHLRRADPVMDRIIGDVGPCRLEVDRRTPVFAALVESILYQQITGKAAATIHERLLNLAGTRRLGPDGILALSAESLRGAGLSRQKIVYLTDLARRTKDGLALGRVGRLSDDRVIETLTAVKGIGRWTAHMFLIFRLGRLDVLPVDDYGVQKAMKQAYRFRSLPDPKRMARVAEPWRPYRSVACWYLWRSLAVAAGRG
jgi:3-methyladenine DNA glycosylase/8-oxoguanine DNA glycosylase